MNTNGIILDQRAIDAIVAAVVPQVAAAILGVQPAMATPAPVVEATAPVSRKGKGKGKKAAQVVSTHSAPTREMVEYRKDHSGAVKVATSAQFLAREVLAKRLGHTLTILRTWHEPVAQAVAANATPETVVSITTAKSAQAATPASDAKMSKDERKAANRALSAALTKALGRPYTVEEWHAAQREAGLR